MSIPSGGLAALLVVAALGLGACGGSDSSVTTTTTVSPGAGTETATQTVAAETTTAKTTTQGTTTQAKTQTTAPKPAQTTTQTTTSKPKPAASSAPCPAVDVGAREGDVDVTYARITSVSNVKCDMVTYVVQQWGGQRIGGEKALLPLDWSCSGNTCRKGSSRVSFVLVPPSD